MINRKNKQKNIPAEKAGGINVENMTDDEFNGYIKNVELGKETAADKASPFRTFETEVEYQDDVDKNLGLYFREVNSQLEDFNKIKQMVMRIFNTGNSDEALYKLIKTAQEASIAEPKKATKRISENGMHQNGAAGEARRSPADMSDKEFQKYIDKLTKRGNI